MTLSPAALPNLWRLALLGAPGSGKTRLCSELQDALAHAAAPACLVCDDPPLTGLRPGMDRVLLMGLDLPASGSLLAAQAAGDQHVRQMLGQMGLPFQVVYGVGAERLHNALTALHASTPSALAVSGASQRQRPWVWACDSCSDPDCERRLLSALIAQKKAVTTAP